MTQPDFAAASAYDEYASNARSTHSQTVLQLVEVACDEAARSQSKVVVEHSDRSEAAYVHVCRQHTWFGYRIACHLPVYAYSADYQQIVVPREADQVTLSSSSAYLRHAIRTDGRVVADPEEVSELIELLEAKRAAEARLPRSAEPMCLKKEPEMAPETEATNSKRTKLSHLERCDVRHRLNRIARWAFEISQQRDSS